MCNQKGYLGQISKNGDGLAVTIPVQYTDLFDIRVKDDTLFTYDGENLIIKIKVHTNRPP